VIGVRVDARPPVVVGRHRWLRVALRQRDDELDGEPAEQHRRIARRVRRRVRQAKHLLDADPRPDPHVLADGELDSRCALQPEAIEWAGAHVLQRDLAPRGPLATGSRAVHARDGSDRDQARGAGQWRLRRLRHEEVRDAAAELEKRDDVDAQRRARVEAGAEIVTRRRRDRLRDADVEAGRDVGHAVVAMTSMSAGRRDRRDRRPSNTRA